MIEEDVERIEHKIDLLYQHMGLDYYNGELKTIEQAKKDYIQSLKEFNEMISTHEKKRYSIHTDTLRPHFDDQEDV